MTDLFFYFLPAIIGGSLSGIVCGALPFFIAKHRRRYGLGFFSMVVCVVGGIVLGVILAAPLAASFAVAILLSEEGQPKPVRDPASVAPTFADSVDAETLV